MDSPDRYKSNISFIDLLFNILVGFVLLFFLAYIMMNPIAKQNDVPSPAQFLVTMTWPNDSTDDIDLWVMDPTGVRVGFQNKDKGIMNLDRDDLGTTNDMIVVGNEIIKVLINQEVISIRGILPGEYHVSAHYYNRRDSVAGVPVTVMVTKVNPYSIVYKQEQGMSEQGEQKNFYKFKVDEEGRVTGIDTPTVSAIPLYRQWGGQQ